MGNVYAEEPSIDGAVEPFFPRSRCFAFGILKYADASCHTLPDEVHGAARVSYNLREAHGVSHCLVNILNRANTGWDDISITLLRIAGTQEGDSNAPRNPPHLG